jgi:hypothetical protein
MSRTTPCTPAARIRKPTGARERAADALAHEAGEEGAHQEQRESRQELRRQPGGLARELLEVENEEAARHPLRRGACGSAPGTRRPS